MSNSNSKLQLHIGWYLHVGVEMSQVKPSQVLLDLNSAWVEYVKLEFG